MIFLPRRLLSASSSTMEDRSWIFNSTSSAEGGGFSTFTMEENNYFCSTFNVYLKWLQTYYVPVIICVGFVGNILSCLVLLTTHLKLRSSSYYLAALAIADLGYLFTVFVVYASYNQLFEMFNKDGFCQAVTYAGSVCAFLSVWLTVAFTAERWVAVRFPLRRPSWCTATRARAAVALLVALAALSQLPVLWLAGVVELAAPPAPPPPPPPPPPPQTGGTVRIASECALVANYETFGKVVNFVDTFATLLVPVVLIVAMNAQIARAVFRSRRGILGTGTGAGQKRPSPDKIRLQHAGSHSSNNSTRLTQEPDSSASVRRNGRYHFSQEYQYIDLRGSSKRPSSTRSNTTAQIQQNINKMLLLISSVFIALNFPSYIVRMYTYFGFTLREEDPPVGLVCAQHFSMILYYTNFAVNFLLYAMCGRTFRLCLRKLFRDAARRACDCACSCC